MWFSQLLTRSLIGLVASVLISECALNQGNTFGEWGDWDDWRDCNRRCGLGIRNRTRECRAVATFRTSQGSVTLQCDGDGVQYSTCNAQPCHPDGPDFRAEQCSSFDKQDFHGKTYTWEPYLTAQPCQLTCKAKGRSFYVKLSERANDGTRCTNDVNSVCIAGQCQAVGCDNVLGSNKVYDLCGVCGGQSNTCKIINGLFKKSHLPYGYNDITVFPRGSCNINVTELAYSRNYLALKLVATNEYIFNSNWNINHNGEFKAAGTIFKYMRPTNRYKPYNEHILAKGPLTEPVALTVLYQQENPGIEYQYTIPRDTAVPGHSIVSETNSKGADAQGQDRFRTVLPGSDDNYGRSVLTSADADYRVNVHQPSYPPSSASLVGPRTRPTSRQPIYETVGSRDNLRTRQPLIAPPRQEPPVASPRVNYGTLSQTAGRLYAVSADIINTNNQARGGGGGSGGTGTSSSSTSAREQTALRDYHTYGGRVASEPKRPQRDSVQPSPQSREPWRNDPDVDRYGVPYAPLYEWRVSGFTECSRSCGGGVQNSRVICVIHSSLAVVTDENCNPGTKPRSQALVCNTNSCPARWVSGSWSACSATCGQGSKQRMVECRQSGTDNLEVSVSATRCLSEPKPSTFESCELAKCHKWKIGDWTKCSSRCGSGTQQRDVYCVDHTDRKSQESLCADTARPDTQQQCRNGPCNTGWMFNTWTNQCSPDCGSGSYTREVLCASRQGCDEGTKPVDRRPCPEDSQQATKRCGGQWFTGPWSKCSESCESSSQTRAVVCLRNTNDIISILNEADCDVTSKPLATQTCEIKSCTAQWYMTEWSECSATCGPEATRSRVVQCLTKDQRMAESCDTDRRPPAQRPCDNVPCPTPPPLDPGCRDLMATCPMVVRARLCSYPYYSQRCCHSCSRHEDVHKRRHRHQKHHKKSRL